MSVEIKGTVSPRMYTHIEGAVVLIPAYNEADVIGGVIAEVKHATNLPIIVIDDASTDSTIAVAEKAGARVISLPTQLGAWGATQTGIRYAITQGFTLVISMDADGQHEAQSLHCLIKPVVEGRCDVTIGACTRRGSLLRKIAWILMRHASGLSLEDITSGFRVYNLAAMKLLSGWRATLLDYQDIGVLLLLQSKGFRIIDVEVEMQPRRNGKSRVFHSWLMVVYYMCHTLLLGLSKRRSGSSIPSAEITG